MAILMSSCSIFVKCKPRASKSSDRSIYVCNFIKKKNFRFFVFKCAPPDISKVMNAVLRFGLNE